jgi:hypothetical protein
MSEINYEIVYLKTNEENGETIEVSSEEVEAIASAKIILENDIILYLPCSLDSNNDIDLVLTENAINETLPKLSEESEMLTSISQYNSMEDYLENAEEILNNIMNPPNPQ